MKISLRPVEDPDLPIFFEYGRDPEAVHMAAFTAEDPSDFAHFNAHWARIRANPEIINRTITDAEGVVLGHIAIYGPPEERELTYWIGRPHWGRGVATAALRALLAIVTERPLHARAAADNKASIQILTNCGFQPVGTERSYANARGAKIEEQLFTLNT